MSNIKPFTIEFQQRVFSDMLDSQYSWDKGLCLLLKEIADMTATNGDFSYIYEEYYYLRNIFRIDIPLELLPRLFPLFTLENAIPFRKIEGGLLITDGYWFSVSPYDLKGRLLFNRWIIDELQIQQENACKIKE